MLQGKLILALLLVAGFSLATCLQPLQSARQHDAGPSGTVLALLLGDARKMFAQQMFAKADAYFHRGNYPSIFDQTEHHEENHMVGESRHEGAGDGDADDDHDEAPTAPKDWIEEFGSHFYPNVHVHLNGGKEREMLPWLQIAAELDPHNIQTYAVTAYWLGDRLHQLDKAEAVLRDGLRANPNSPELLYALGHLLYAERQDYKRARNLWQFALRRWHEVEQPKPEPNKLLLAELLGGLARVEMREGNPRSAIEFLKQLKELSPSPEHIQQQIDQISRQAGLAS